MGLLDGPISSITSALTPGSLSPKTPAAFKPDFTEGFIIQEVDSPDQTLALQGSLMPHIPFETGGEQNVKKDYYVGNPEPVVQVLGSREDDLAIHGRIFEKRNHGEARGAADDIRKALDTFRLRGNLLQISLGEWRRYAYMTNAHFKMTNLGDIEYEIKFCIVSMRKPRNNYFTQEDANLPLGINADLTKKLAAFQSRPIPSVPQSLGDILNRGISNVAGAVNTVTGFVDNVLGTAQDVTKSLARAKGLVKNAQTSLSQYKRSVGALSYQWAALFPNSNRIDKIKMTSYVAGSMSDVTSMQDYLQSLHDKFAALSKTVPMVRHRVTTGDTLQELSVRYYGKPDSWKAIYDHNKLTSTVLVIGSILEIPKP